MKKRFAIPMFGDTLSEHFGHCQAFAFVDIENNNISSIIMKEPPEHQPGAYPRWVAGNGATDVIAGGMGLKAINLFNEAGINVFVGAPVDTAANLVNNFLAKTLILEANYCDHSDNCDEHQY